MIYLLIGPQSEIKESKITELKAKSFPTDEAILFDYEILYGHKLEPATFKKALLALPVMAKQRFILLREAHRLSAQNQAIVLEFFKNKEDNLNLVLDAESEIAQDFVKQLNPYVKTLEFAEEVPPNVFDMTRAIERRNSQEALTVLTDLFEGGQHPLQIMGGLIWFWRKLRPRLQKQKFHTGLVAMQETDLSIKRSRLEPQHAMEVLVVKLCSLV